MKRILLLPLMLTACQAGSSQPPTTNPPTKPPHIVLEEKNDLLIQQHHLPSLSIVLADDRKILNQASSGVRKYGSPEKVTLQDVHHLGSITKSMTATLIATYVENKKLSFQSTLKDLFPGTAMRKEYENITVDQLLSHRSGIVANLNDDESWWDGSIPLATRKASFLKTLLQTPLNQAPGTRFEYSNASYALLAMIAEKVGKKSFEFLLDTHVFKPLQMKNCSVGFTWDTSKVSQPWPHELKNNVPVPISPEYPTEENGFVIAGNTEVINGADNVRCPMSDLVRYLQDHLNGENGKKGLLKAATYQELHKDHYGDHYGYGWVVEQGENGLLLAHDGSNTLNYARVLLFPKSNLILIGATNIGSEDAGVAIDAGMGEAVKLQGL